MRWLLTVNPEAVTAEILSNAPSESPPANKSTVLQIVKLVQELLNVNYNGSHTTLLFHGSIAICKCCASNAHALARGQQEGFSNEPFFFFFFGSVHRGHCTYLSR